MQVFRKWTRNLTLSIESFLDDIENHAANVAAAIREVFDEADRVLGVLTLRQAEDARPPVPPEEIERMIALRRDARRARDFARADEIRRELETKGIVLEDTAAGTRWKRK